MTYQQALAYVASLEPRGWRLGLDRMEEFCARLGLQNDLKAPVRDYFHVAGTNGKGSTTTFLQYLLYAQDKNIGAFFSPYVVDPRERIQIGIRLLSKEDFASLVEQIQPVAESMSSTEFGGITEFEFKTAMGFVAWAQKGCQSVALETGLGGRLDATNVVTSTCSTISSIGLDHQAILGNSLAEIASEKAGIIKPERPIVIGKLPAEAREVIVGRANELASPIYEEEVDFRIDDNGNYQSRWGSYSNAIPKKLTSNWQPHNFALAISSLLASGREVNQSMVEFAAQEAFLPGRYQKERIGKTQWIFDGAHNGDSVESLAASFLSDPDLTSKRTVVISNMVQGHLPEQFYKVLAPLTDLLIVPPIHYHRSRPRQEVFDIAESLAIPVLQAGSLDDAIKLAMDRADQEELPILVTGSFYLVGEAIRELHLDWED